MRSSTRKAVVATAASLVLIPMAGCGFMKGVGKTTVGVAKTTGKVVTWPVRAAQGKTGKGASTAPVVGAGTMVEPGTVIVGARPVDNTKTGANTKKSGTTVASKPSTTSRGYGYDGSEILIDGMPIDSPSQIASTPSTGGRR